MMILYHSMVGSKTKNEKKGVGYVKPNPSVCLLYTSDAADE